MPQSSLTHSVKHSAFLLLILLTAIGCEDSTPDGDGSVGRGGEVREVRRLLDTDGWGTLRGRVTFEGEPPLRLPIPVQSHIHAEVCSQGELVEETWIVDPETQGVANVVVWLEPPSGTYFPPQPAEQRTWADEVIIDQPFCMFRPHVTVLYPSRYDAEEQGLVSTGQDFIIRNSAAVQHQATVKGSNTRNPERGSMLPPKPANGEAREVTVKVKPDSRVIDLSCSLHPWMRAYVWAFDHPYAAITDAQGNYAIRHAPAGAEVRVRAWHEAGELSLPKAGERITLDADAATVLEFSVTKPD